MENTKRLLKAFAVIFLLNLLIFNWSKISWIFSYHYISAAFSEEQTEIVPTADLQRENSIEIPAIGISAPIITSDNLSPDYEEELKNGVVHYLDSALPGEKGQTILLGHSAPLNWPKIRYDWVFSDLNKLKEGDSIFVYFDGKKYDYMVEEISIIEKSGKISDSFDNGSSLVLMSCWPPGKDSKRIIVKSLLNI